MNRLKGRWFSIIAIAVALLLVVGWYFFLLAPKRTEIADLTTQIETAQADLSAKQQQLVRYKTYKKSAPQARTEIVRLGKMLPESEGIPSLIVDLTKASSSAGVVLDTISRGDSKAGSPFGIQTVTISISGRFFDVEDFLHRLENYVSWRNDKFRVTGRLLQVNTVSVSAGEVDTTSTSPVLTVTLTIDAYLWGGKASSTGTATTTQAKGDGS